MAYCAKCGNNIGEAHTCPRCGQPSANQTVQTPITEATAGTNLGTSQPGYYQQNPQAFYAHKTEKASPLVLIAGIVLIAVGFYFLTSSIVGIFSFMSLFMDSSLNFLSLDMYPWPQVLFSLFVDLVMIAMGIVALVFAKRIRKETLVMIGAAVSGVLLLIRLIILSTTTISNIALYGISYFDQSSTIVYGLIPTSYAVQQGFNIFLLLLAVAAAVILFLLPLMARKR